MRPIQRPVSAEVSAALERAHFCYNCTRILDGDLSRTAHSGNASRISLGTLAFPVYAVRYCHAHAQNVMVCGRTPLEVAHFLAEFPHTHLHSARARACLCNNGPRKIGRPGFRG